MLSLSRNTLTYPNNFAIRLSSTVYIYIRGIRIFVDHTIAENIRNMYELQHRFDRNSYLILVFSLLWLEKYLWWDISLRRTSHWRLQKHKRCWSSAVTSDDYFNNNIQSLLITKLIRNIFISLSFLLSWHRHDIMTSTFLLPTKIWNVLPHCHQW